MDEFYQQRSHGVQSPVGWSSRTVAGLPTRNSLLGIGSHRNSFPPTKILNEKIRAREWDTARLRVLSYPWDAFYRSKQMNNATPLHLACLYRAPLDLVELVLDANPQALFCQDSEGWSPLHVILLYGSDDEIALMLIRRGGARAASIQSRSVGSPLHLACRHGCSKEIIAELLRANPAMASTANQYSTKPAKILWHQYSRNPENERLLMELRNNHSQNSLPEIANSSIIDLVDRLALLLRAAKGKHRQEDNDIDNKSALVHDVVVATEATLGDLGQFVSLVVLLYPEQVRSADESGNFPLHKAASNKPSKTAEHDRLRRSVSLPSFTSIGSTNANANNSNTSFPHHDGDPIEVLVQCFPIAARIPNRQGLLPLHLALAKGRRTWRTGIAVMVMAAPEALYERDVETNLFPFQLAAMNFSSSNNNSANNKAAADHENIEVIETILELLLACPHVMTASIPQQQ
jgi:ankyrin repeat protein